MENQSSIKKNFMMNCILTISSFLVPLVTFPYVSRILLPAGVGKVSFAASVVVYFSLFAQLGIPTYGIRTVAQNRDDKSKLSKKVIEISIINFVMCTVVLILFGVMVFTVAYFREVKSLYCILGITIITDSIGIEWLYKGLEKYTYIAIRSLVFKILAIIGIFLLVRSSEDYLVYALFTVFASVGSNICNLFSVHKYVGIEKVNIQDVIKHIKPILIFFSMTVATTIYTNLDNVMLGFMANEIEVGYYSTIVKLRMLVLSVVTALGGVLLPRASYYIENHMYEAFYKVSRKALHFIVLLAVPLTLFVMLIADKGIYILAGESFMPADRALRFIMPTVILVGISNLTGIQMLIPMNREKVVVKSVACGAVVDFVLNLFLIPKYFASGAALATTIAEIVVLAVQLLAFSKETRRILFNQSWGVILAGNLIAVFACIITLHVIDSVWLCALGAAISYFGVYCLILLFGRDEMALEIIQNIVNGIRRIKKCR